MRPFRATATYDAPVAEVATMIADPEFVRVKVAASDPVEFSSDVQSGPDGGFTITTTRTIGPDRLPPAARRFAGDGIRMQLVERWGPAAADGSRTGPIELDVLGRPASARGTATLRPTGPTSTELVYEGQVQARIPLIGARVEELAGAQVREALERERVVGVRWLAGPRTD